jgi:hypothetical protein
MKCSDETLHWWGGHVLLQISLELARTACRTEALQMARNDENRQHHGHPNHHYSSPSLFPLG